MFTWRRRYQTMLARMLAGLGKMPVSLLASSEQLSGVLDRAKPNGYFPEDNLWLSEPSSPPWHDTWLSAFIYMYATLQRPTCVASHPLSCSLVYV